MKNIAIIIVFGLSIITGCTGVKTVTKGLESQSYIELIGNPSYYSGGVDVTIDGTTFKAEVNKAGAKRPKGTVYAISTGRHVVSVKYNNETIYSKQIFVSAQETKQIILQ
jgi:hypothetical protein